MAEKPSNFACPGQLHSCHSLLGPLPTGQVRVKSFLLFRKIYLSRTTGWDFFFQALEKKVCLQVIMVYKSTLSTQRETKVAGKLLVSQPTVGKQIFLGAVFHFYQCNFVMRS